MYIDDFCADQIRAHVYLTIKDRELAKQAAHDLIMKISTYEPGDFREIRIPIPFQLRAEPIAENTLENAKVIDMDILTLRKERFPYANWDGSYFRWRVAL